MDVATLAAEAATLSARGDHPAAMTRYTRILALAAAGTTHEAWTVATAHMQWVEAARFCGVPLRSLFAVLDAAERYLDSIGHPEWRGGLLAQRAATHRELGDWDKAVELAEEAVETHVPGAPGTTLATLRYRLGDILCEAGRPTEAVPHFRAVLDDPGVRYKALVGLTHCELNRMHRRTALRHATAAVREAGPLGDEALRLPLHALVAAQRALGDLDAATATAARYVDCAHRLNSTYVLFFALRSAADVALDRHDVTTARDLLAGLELQASVLDDANGHTRRSAEVAKRRHRLSTLR
ncbi:tetratricopeptide repeat protein [Actinoplanes solisilvae]|uniref:tetratricopeptide repeat protein n=1 Tax=Actinoplanes solisilvae TaxID=2486853 RepID=UPI000FD8C50E|nr:tetratricopeptide repeat protein [Actinoplanes solisilvae]